MNDVGVLVEIAIVSQSKIIRTTSFLWEMGSDFALFLMISSLAGESASANQNNDMEEIIMKTLISCEYHEDSQTVELRYTDGML